MKRIAILGSIVAAGLMAVAVSAQQGPPAQSEFAGNGYGPAGGRWVRHDGKIIVHGA